MTALLIEGSYHGKEFFRLGYYMHHEYVDDQLKENPPDEIAWDHLQRVILSDKPIITKPQIEWDNNGTIQDLVPADNSMMNLVGDPFSENLGVFDHLHTAQMAENNNMQAAWGNM